MRIVFNTRGGVSQCIKATYHKTSLANFLHTDGRRTCGVMEINQADDEGTDKPM